MDIRDQVDKDTGKRRPTNVTKVARAVRPRALDGTDQIVYPHDGVGTGGLTDRVTGGAFGRGMEDNIRVLYRFIVCNYEPNDELYFCGFSRGAFAVRSLAGFMNKVGLIEKDDDFNSVLHDSMTTMYKVMGPRPRTLGEHARDGEVVHQSAIDRRNLPTCAYTPHNLKIYVERADAVQVINTTRIPRGTPCPDLP